MFFIILSSSTLSLVYLQNNIQQKTGVSVPFGLLYECSFEELERFVLTHTACEESKIDWEKEISMEGYEVYQNKEENKKEVKNVLLTGANGFLGIYLLQELLSRGYLVYCLLRGNGRKKLEESCNFHQLRIELKNVKIIEGDLSQKHFGLSFASFKELAHDIDLCIHNGCYVNGIYPYSLLKKVNVNSTKDCISLCSFRNIKLIYISSLSSLLPGEREENIKLDVCSSMERMSGYGQSKRVSEILVHKHCRSNNYFIVRPGTIGSSTTTGSSNLNDTLSKLFLGMVEMKRAPKLPNTHITIIPVDVCSSIIVNFMLDDRLNLNLFGEVIKVDEIVEAFGMSVKLERVPFKDFVQYLLHLEEECILTPLKEYFKSFQLPLQDDGMVANRSKYECKKVDLELWVKFLQNKNLM